MPATTATTDDDKIPYSCTERDILGTEDGYTSGLRHARARSLDMIETQFAKPRADLIQEIYFIAFERLYGPRETEIGSEPGERGRRSLSVRRATWLAGFMGGYLAVIDGKAE